jgi:hypothetical protein
MAKILAKIVFTNPLHIGTHVIGEGAFEASEEGQLHELALEDMVRVGEVVTKQNSTDGQSSVVHDLSFQVENLYGSRKCNVPYSQIEMWRYLDSDEDKHILKGYYEALGQIKDISKSMKAPIPMKRGNGKSVNPNNREHSPRSR